MRHSFLGALVVAVALACTATASAVQPVQTIVRPFDEAFDFSNEDETCQFQMRFVGFQIFRFFVDRGGEGAFLTEQGRTTITLTNLLTGETLSGVNSFNVRSTFFEPESAQVGDIVTLLSSGAGLNATLFPAKGPPIVLAGHTASEITFRVLVNDPETGEFEAEVLSGDEDVTPHLRHLISTAGELFCS